MQTIPVIQSKYPEAGLIVPAIAHAMDTMETNSHWLYELPENNVYEIIITSIDHFNKMVVLVLF